MYAHEIYELFVEEVSHRIRLFMQVNFMKELETSFWDFVHKLFEKIILYLCYRTDIYSPFHYILCIFMVQYPQNFKTLLFGAFTFYSKTSSLIRLFGIVWRIITWSVCKKYWLLLLCLYIINNIEMCVIMWG